MMRRPMSCPSINECPFLSKIDGSHNEVNFNVAEGDVSSVARACDFNRVLDEFFYLQSPPEDDSIAKELSIAMLLKVVWFEYLRRLASKQLIGATRVLLVAKTLEDDSSAASQIKAEGHDRENPGTGDLPFGNTCFKKIFHFFNRGEGVLILEISWFFHHPHGLEGPKRQRPLGFVEKYTIKVSKNGMLRILEIIFLKAPPIEELMVNQVPRGFTRGEFEIMDLPPKSPVPQENPRSVLPVIPAGEAGPVDQFFLYPYDVNRVMGGDCVSSI
ncbi:hypothetical protein RHGRI_030472 [Rhododendron griersonianum]|uniref:Uncharacterized protein n=1 Tax=Rhododendron griersonianum TaxID=479676 RepID=A0AAV6IN24_9ERIC|nr:hypothetical protein RHGRI_030472 [Rhododendron griersonianum]